MSACEVSHLKSVRKRSKMDFWLEILEKDRGESLLRFNNRRREKDGDG
jgi:hypothetical protein